MGAAVHALDLSRIEAGRRKLIMLRLHGVRAIEVEADVEGLGVADILLLPSHERHDEILIVVHRREHLSRRLEMLEPEEPLEEGGEAHHVGSGEVEMLELH